MGIGTIIDQIIEGIIVTKGMDIEIRTTVGLEKWIEIGVVQEKVSQSRGGNQSQNRNDNRRQSRNNNRDRSESRSRSTSHVSTNRDRCRCYMMQWVWSFCKRMP